MKFTIKVPATSANLGPGFDALGLALDLWNETTITPAKEFSVQVSGEGAGDSLLGRIISSSARRRGWRKARGSRCRRFMRSV
ncbi:MAG: hypothetical protein U0X93_00115 [Anaerolineales bacterium]